MDAGTLENTIRYVGVAVAFLGCILAAPSGAVRLVEGGASAARRVGVAVLQGLGFGKDRHVSISDGLTASGSVSTTGSASLTTRSSTIEGRIAALEQDLQQVRARAEAIGAKAAQDVADVRGELSEASARITAELEELRRRVRAAEEKASKVDAVALPVVGLGVVLTGIPQELARSAPLGVGMIIFALVVLAGAGVLTLRARHLRAA